MTDQLQSIEWPPLREHDFRSNVPLLGSMIQAARRGLYRLTAKWGVRVVIDQQNQINGAIARRLTEDAAQLHRLQVQLAEHDARLIDQDRELVALARTVAELQVQLRALSDQARSADHTLSTESRS